MVVVAAATEVPSVRTHGVRRGRHMSTHMSTPRVDVRALLDVLLPGSEDSPAARLELAVKLRAAAAALDDTARAPGGEDGATRSGAAGTDADTMCRSNVCARGSVDEGRGAAVSSGVKGRPSSGPRADGTSVASESTIATGKEVSRLNDDAKKAAKKARKAFDFSRYPTRHVAFHVMYAGWSYHGFASQGAETSGVATVEGALFAALKKTRLIAPDASWKDCDYTRCGRTDAGVSALGQIISVRVRSKIPVVEGEKGDVAAEEEEDDRGVGTDGSGDSDAGDDDDVLVIRNVGKGYVRRKKRRTRAAPAPPPAGLEELDYPAVINRALPDDVRVLGWSYVDKDYSARFDCQFRHYKYFFAAWGGLDLNKMREAGRRLEGEHDFRNFCKMDAKNVHNYRRKIMRCAIVSPGYSDHDQDVKDGNVDDARNDWARGGGANGVGATGLGASSTSTSSSKLSPPPAGVPPQLCYISIKGTAFLWHQVRCIAAVLFLVGLGREDVDVVDRLLDLGVTPRKPQYEMAPDEPLLLWSSGFKPHTIDMRLSAAARTQLELHVAQCVQRHMVRAGVWAEAWAHLRLEESSEGEGAPLSLVSTVTALSTVGASAVGGNSRADHVPLAKRATEPTYDERRQQLMERGGGDVVVANSYRATVEDFVARKAKERKA